MTDPKAAIHTVESYQAWLVEARTRAEVEEIQAKSRAEAKRREAEAEAEVERLVKPEKRPTCGWGAHIQAVLPEEEPHLTG